MKLLFVHDHRFVEKDGVVYSNQFPASVLGRYLDVFDSLTFIGRKQTSSECIAGKIPMSTMPGVDFIFMPSLSTSKSFLFTRQKVRKQIVDLLKSHDKVIVRLPSELGLLTAETARTMKKSYAVELVGCPLDALWYYGTMFARFYAPIQAARSRYAVWRADAVCYVTKSYLQNRYPSGKYAITANISNVSIPAVANVGEIGKVKPLSRRIRVGIIGSLQTRYKGVHTAIEALTRLVRAGVDIELRILGGGDPQMLLMQAERSGVSCHVYFDGTLPSGKAVHEWLDKLDIYAQPSLTEGLPRALIEAMSRGLPAVASRVGGIPELLREEFLFPPGDAGALADRLSNFVASPGQRMSAGRSNVEKAAEYLRNVLDSRRSDFLLAVKNSGGGKLRQ